MSIRSQSYKLEDEVTLKHEKERLLFQAQAFIKAELPIYEDLGLKKGGVVLDLGCGNGAYIKTLNEYFPNCKFFGIDYNKKLLENAQTLAPFASFNYMDLFNSEDLERFINQTSPDFIILRFVLQHLTIEEISKVITSIANTLKSEKKLIIIDTSDINISFKPRCDSFNALIERKRQLQKNDGGDRNIGLKVEDLLSTHSWKKVSSNTLDIGSNTNSWGALKTVLLPIYSSKIIETSPEVEMVNDLSTWFNECKSNPSALLVYPINMICATK